MEVTTINEIVLPYFLFLGYFCFFCLGLREARKYQSAPACEPTPNELIDRKLERENSSYPSQFKLVVSALIEKLSCEQIETLCQQLNIERAIAGRYKDCFHLQSEIKHIFRKHPREVIGALSFIIAK